MANIQNEPREIDLIELFNIMGRGIKNAFLSIIKAILFLIVFGIKRAHYLILFALVGAAIGWIFYSASQRYYTSDLIAQPNGINASEMVEYINDLNKFCKRKNIAALAYSLDLPDSISKKIKNIEAFKYIDVNNDEIGDYVDFSNRFNPLDTSKSIDEKRILLRVEVYDNKAFSNVREGLFTYISKNPYLLKLNQIRKEELTELIATCNKEIIKLDSLQNVEYFKSNNRFAAGADEGVLFLSEKNKLMYYRDKLNLLNLKQQHQKEFDLATSPITVIKDFTQLTIEENPRGKYIIRFGFWFGILGYFLLLLIKYRKELMGLVNPSL